MEVSKLSKYQARTVHKVVIESDSGMWVEKECEASWWVNAPAWAQLYILDGMRRELEKAEAQVAAEDAAKEAAQLTEKMNTNTFEEPVEE